MKTITFHIRKVLILWATYPLGFLANFRATQPLAARWMGYLQRAVISLTLDIFLQNHSAASLGLVLQQNGFICRQEGDATIYIKPGRPDLGTWKYRRIK